MIADVTHFTKEEGGDWKAWPFRSSIKPSNPELLICRANAGEGVYHWKYSYHGSLMALSFHALKLNDGSEWDCVNGFRDRGGPR